MNGKRRSSWVTTKGLPNVYKQCLSCRLHPFIFLLTGVRVEGFKALLSDLRQNPKIGQGFRPHFHKWKFVALILTCLFQWNAPVDDDEDVRDPQGRLGNFLSRTPAAAVDVVVPVEHADDDDDGSM